MNISLAFEVSLLSNYSFLSGSFFAAGAIALTIALAITLVAIAIAVAVAITATAAVAGAQQLLSPGNDAVTIGGGQVHDAGDSSQCYTNFYNHFKSFHVLSLHLRRFPISV
jgi:uncharacterized SAM-binding protein YcdF (DUF218 family)